MPQNRCRGYMGFAHHEYSADLCAIDVKEVAYSTMELFLPHHESKWIRFQYSYMILEMITIPLWPNNNRQAELVSKDLSYSYSTECIERELIARSPVGSYGLFLQWGQCWLGFHPCIGRCPPQHSETCSIPTGEQMYLSSVFFTWLKKHSHLDITP